MGIFPGDVNKRAVCSEAKCPADGSSSPPTISLLFHFFPSVCCREGGFLQERRGGGGYPRVLRLCCVCVRLESDRVKLKMPASWVEWALFD